MFNDESFVVGKIWILSKHRDIMQSYFISIHPKHLFGIRVKRKLSFVAMVEINVRLAEKVCKYLAHRNVLIPIALAAATCFLYDDVGIWCQVWIGHSGSLRKEPFKWKVCFPVYYTMRRLVAAETLKKRIGKPKMTFQLCYTVWQIYRRLVF